MLSNLAKHSTILQHAIGSAVPNSNRPTVWLTTELIPGVIIYRSSYAHPDSGAVRLALQLDHLYRSTRRYALPSEPGLWGHCCRTPTCQLPGQFHAPAHRADTLCTAMGPPYHLASHSYCDSTNPRTDRYIGTLPAFRYSHGTLHQYANGYPHTRCVRHSCGGSN